MASRKRHTTEIPTNSDKIIPYPIQTHEPSLQESTGQKKSSRKGKRVKRLIRYQLQLISLPLILAYYEILMMLFRRTNLSLFYPLAFAIGIGFALNGLLAFLPRKLYIWLKGIIIGCTAVIFISQCLIRSSFQQYMPYKVVLNGISGIARHYSGQALAAIIFGLPLIAAYLVPLVIYIIIYSKWRLKTSQPMLKKLFLVTFGTFVILCTWLVAVIGPSNAIYRESYTFNNATQHFGLLTSARLDLEYSLLGNKYQDALTLIENAAVEAPVETKKQVSETPAPQETVVNASSSEEDTRPDKPAFVWEAYDDLNVMDIDFDALIAGTQDDVVREMHSYVSSLIPTHKNSYTGAFAGKNLILITAEALSDCAVDPNITPTLYRMANNGFRFEKFYQPSWGGSTSTGEFSFVTGIIPLDGEETIMETINNNLYFTLGNALQRENYYSRAYHNGDYEFYHRDQTHQNLGYSEFIASLQTMESITGYSYPADSVMFDKTLDTYSGLSPFSTYYMTISGHSDYVPGPLVDEGLALVNQYYGDRYKDTTKYYLCYQMELDRAMNLLISKLEQAGIADNTVIAICPDHYPYGLEQSATFGNTEDYLADLYGYVYSNWMELDHSVGIIWSKCMEKDPSEEGYVAPATIASVSNSIDMVPTLLNLFDIEYDSRMLPGRDCLDPGTEGFVVWENHSWLTDYVYHDSSSNRNILMDGSGQDAGPEWNDYIAQKTAEANNKITYSSRVVTKNYFGVLFGPDEIK